MGGGILSRRSVIAAAMLAPFGAAAAADVVGPLTPRQRQERLRLSTSCGAGRAPQRPARADDQ